MRIQYPLFPVFLILIFSTCSDDAGNKGSLTLSVTDAPADNDAVQGVNLYISSIDALTGSQWKSLKSFDEPAGVNLLRFSGGNSATLIDQFIDPGKFTAFRFNMNLADLNNSLILSPQCNVSFTDGTLQPIYTFQPGVMQFIVPLEININALSGADLTFDFDVRKSLRLDSLGHYVFKPSIRVVQTARAGHIQGSVINYNPANRLVVFAYPAGQYSSAESNPPAAGSIRFMNAISSSKIIQYRFGIGFLPAGNYDLIFASQDQYGEFLSVSGRLDNVTVAATAVLRLVVDLTQLSGS